MAVAVEEKKARLVKKAAALAAELDRAAQAERLVAEFYEHVPPGDVAERQPRDLCGAALSLRHFAARRQPGQAKIRVFNPVAAEDGWSSPHTIVEIVNDDMPFLVDSVTGAINAGDRTVHLVIHPILDVARDDQGRLVAIDRPGRRESWMQIEVTREIAHADLARLTETLSAVLTDVRSAVADWPTMRRVLADIVAELSEPPLPPVRRQEIDETRAFLRWLDDDNFTFLGFREYPVDAAANIARVPLGLLRDDGHPAFRGLREIGSLPPDVQEFVARRELLVVSKSNRRSTVHRTAHMDAIGVRRFAGDGQVVGIRLFLGLFTSLAYSGNPRTIPLLRQKVKHIVARSGLSPDSHDGKALAHIIDSYPRDELFQADEQTLHDTVTGILNLQERRRIALFVRRDPLERFVSCVVFCPRDRYDSALRQRFGETLAEAYDGEVLDYFGHLDGSPLARVQFIIRTNRGRIRAVNVAALEKRLAEAGRSWAEQLQEAAVAAFGEAEAHTRLRALGTFPVGYQARTDMAQAVADLGYIEQAAAGAPLAVSLHPKGEGATPGLRIYRATEPVVLSDVLPILENLGLRVVAEEPFRIDLAAGGAVWVHEFTLSGTLSVPGPVRARFEEALAQVWTGQVENDGFNRLVPAGGLSARQISILRLYGKVLRQAGSTFSQAYMEDALSAQPEIAARLIALFEARFDPERQSDRLASVAEIQAIDHALDGVESLDEDRILRSYLALILKSVRTNYFQRLPSGRPKPYLAVKLASGELDFLPKPRPLYEIYVYSPRVEGVHMRAGRVARGGIRWSDRKEDFRTEILGLMKAQTVKNAVIVPVGSKGGFVVKQPPAARDQLQAEAVECYTLLIRGLLDVTDNIVAEGPGRRRIAPPPDVVRHDADDPYLVVAADKGTATFSDYANAVSEEYGFWLGDAFASGGSAGYDHKAMGITSRGAWELVKRHFRELGQDILATPFTVVGVGDMSGDVFGNGMLMSRNIRLLGAFNHLHVFVDPDPDPEKSFAERQRLLHLPRSSWSDYDPSLISPGGAVFERAAKSIPVSSEMKRIFDIAEDRLTPAELIRKMLAAAVDLVWFGGIGTYVKARAESQAEAGDRANDALRIDAEAIRAKVVGEGANLAVTQRGRIAYALKGGRIENDAVDNSAGVDTSDHEVNIKILVDHAIASGTLAAAEREPLLAQLTDDIAHHVLRDNYLQGAALSLAEARGVAALDRQARLIRDLERTGRLDRALEFLPDDETLAARAAHRQGLVRPELAVLLAYAKMSLDEALLASDLPDLPELADELHGYFPAVLRERLGGEIAGHPLHREIAATVVANDLVNRAGITFVHDLVARTGRTAPEIARAYLIVRDVLDLNRRWAEIEALDGKIAAATQTEMLLDIMGLVEHAAAWLLHKKQLDIGAEAARLRPSVAGLATALPDLLPERDCAQRDARAGRLAETGVPADLAAWVAGSMFLASAIEIADLAERTGQPFERAARVYYGAGARFALDDMRGAARRLPAETAWQKQAVEATIDDVYSLQAAVAARILRSKAASGAADPLAAWTAAQPAAVLAPADTVARELRAASAPDLAMLVVAGRQLRQALG